MPHEIKPEVLKDPDINHTFVLCIPRMLRAGPFNSEDTIDRMKQCQWFDRSQCVDKGELQNADCTNLTARAEITVVDKMEEI